MSDFHRFQRDTQAYHQSSRDLNKLRHSSSIAPLQNRYKFERFHNTNGQHHFYNTLTSRRNNYYDNAFPQPTPDYDSESEEEPESEEDDETEENSSLELNTIPNPYPNVFPSYFSMENPQLDDDVDNGGEYNPYNPYNPYYPYTDDWLDYSGDVLACGDFDDEKSKNGKNTCDI